MKKAWFREYHADLCTSHLRITFLRLFEDVQDIMSDAFNPTWVGTDEFRVYCQKLQTTEMVEHVHDTTHLFPVIYTCVEKKQDVVDEQVFNCNKHVANMIWKAAKKYDQFEACVHVARVYSK